MEASGQLRIHVGQIHVGGFAVSNFRRDMSDLRLSQRWPWWILSKKNIKTITDRLTVNSTGTNDWMLHAVRFNAFFTYFFNIPNIYRCTMVGVIVLNKILLLFKWHKLPCLSFLCVCFVFLFFCLLYNCSLDYHCTMLEINASWVIRENNLCFQYSIRVYTSSSIDSRRHRNRSQLGTVMHYQKKQYISRIWGFHSGDNEGFYLLGCDAV
jgi:hypothetical protein